MAHWGSVEYDSSQLWPVVISQRFFFNPPGMDTPEVEADGFEAGEAFTGPHDCQIVLYYGHQRFILTMAKPESREDGDVVANLFLKLKEAKNDLDEMMVDR